MKDPVEARADDDDLYDIASWEPRTALDRLAIRTHRGVVRAGRRFLVGLGVLILISILAFSGAGGLILDDPYILGLAALSVIPAGLLALYIYRADITTKEPPSLLVVTFILSVLFAGFAAVINTAFAFLQLFPLIGLILFFYLVVGPVEESVKLLAVWLYPYRDPVRFGRRRRGVRGRRRPRVRRDRERPLHHPEHPDARVGADTDRRRRRGRVRRHARSRGADHRRSRAGGAGTRRLLGVCGVLPRIGEVQPRERRPDRSRRGC